MSVQVSSRYRRLPTRHFRYGASQMVKCPASKCRFSESYFQTTQKYETVCVSFCCLTCEMMTSCVCVWQF